MVEPVSLRDSLAKSELGEASAPHRGEMLRVDALERPSPSFGFQQELLERELEGLLSSGAYAEAEITHLLTEGIELSIVPQADLPNPQALLVAIPNLEPPEILINGDLIESEALFIKMYDLDERQRHHLLALALLPSLIQDATEVHEFMTLQNALNESLWGRGNYLVPLCEEIELLGLLAHLETVTEILQTSAQISNETGISAVMLRRVFESPALGVLSRALVAEGGARGLANGQSPHDIPQHEMTDAAFSVLRQFYRDEFSILATPDWAPVAQELRGLRLQLEQLQASGTSIGGVSDANSLGVWALTSGISPTGLARLSQSFLYQEAALSQAEVVRSTLQGLLSQRLEERGVLRYFEPLRPPSFTLSP